MGGQKNDNEQSILQKAFEMRKEYMQRNSIHKSDYMVSLNTTDKKLSQLNQYKQYQQPQFQTLISKGSSCSQINLQQQQTQNSNIQSQHPFYLNLQNQKQFRNVITTQKIEDRDFTRIQENPYQQEFTNQDDASQQMDNLKSVQNTHFDQCFSHRYNLSMDKFAADKGCKDFKPFKEIMQLRKCEKDQLLSQLERKHNSFELLKKNFASGCSLESDSPDKNQSSSSKVYPLKNQCHDIVQQNRGEMTSPSFINEVVNSTMQNQLQQNETSHFMSPTNINPMLIDNDDSSLRTREYTISQAQTLQISNQHPQILSAIENSKLNTIDVQMINQNQDEKTEFNIYSENGMLKTEYDNLKTTTYIQIPSSRQNPISDSPVKMTTEFQMIRNNSSQQQSHRNQMQLQNHQETDKALEQQNLPSMTNIGFDPQLVSTDSDEIKNMMKQEITRLQEIYNQYNKENKETRQNLNRSDINVNGLQLNSTLNQTQHTTQQQTPIQLTQTQFHEQSLPRYSQNNLIHCIEQSQVLQNDRGLQINQNSNDLISQNNRPSLNNQSQVFQHDSSFEILTNKLNKNYQNALKDLNLSTISNTILSQHNSSMQMTSLVKNKQTYQERLNKLMKDNQLKGNNLQKGSQNCSSLISNGSIVQGSVKSEIQRMLGLQFQRANQNRKFINRSHS